MASFGINVPRGIPVTSLDQVAAAADSLAGDEVVVKSQILAGGRGLGKFTSGFQGGVHLVQKDKAVDVASKMLGGTLVTKQTGPAGRPVNTLLIAEKMNLLREMYFSIVLDRKTAGPVMIACAEGGTSIEDLAAKSPEKIIRIPIDIRAGISDADAMKAVEGLGVTTDKEAAAEQIKRLYKLFASTDSTMLEVNPLAETSEGLLAADAKLGFDDSASYRQKELFAMADESQQDPREREAAKADLNFIALDGSIGCLVNGAGLAMATMDIIQAKGASPANFCDVGGNASEEQIVAAFSILEKDPKVKAILVNIFGGIMRCDVVASGIIAAAKRVNVKVPIVVRLEGTKVNEAKKLLAESGIDVINASDLDDAAEKAAQAALSG
jgi:succinyl-CoA synthetase beta subunit